jgi:hypothetical protein
MKRLLILALLIASACGSKGGSSSGAASCGSKDLFSQWLRDDGAFQLDLSGGSFGVQYTTSVTFGGGMACTGQVIASGSQCSASAVISGSTWNGIGAGDPGCASLNGTDTISKDSSGLTVCDHVGCEHYQ